jgi:hypothetical protein
MQKVEGSSPFIRFASERPAGRSIYRRGAGTERNTQVRYQDRDQHILDYDLFEFCGLSLRGPKPALDPGHFFVCLGAAQTFGRFCERPYPTLLSEQLGLPVLNLSAPAAGPLFFLRRSKLLEHVNRARFVIVQVMSGRTEMNSRFDSSGGGLLTRRSDGSKVAAEPAYRELLETEDVEVVRQLVAETRSNWVAHYRELLATIQIPTVLLWFSRRPPAYQEDYSNVRRLFGAYPQLVNEEMVEELRPNVDDYVECVTSRGLPQPLFDGKTGDPTTVAGPEVLGDRALTHNTYYPSPEMHEDAAASLRATAASIARASAPAG